MKIFKTPLIALAMILCFSNITISQPFPSGNSPGFYEIQARIRNGNSGFESGLFTPSTPAPGQSGPGQVLMNPNGAPIWNTNGNVYGDIHTFYFSYDASTGTSEWKIDFNRDGDYNDAEEVKTNIAGTLSGQNFKYIDLRVQGSSSGFAAIVNNFIINGIDFGTLLASNESAVHQTYENSSGFFQNVLVTGSFSIGGNGGQESPRIWISLGEFTPPCTPVTPSLTINANPGNTICSGSTVTFTAIPVNGGSTPSYQWKLNGTDIGFNGPVYLTDSLIDQDIISCVLTSSAICAIPSQANSNNIIVSVSSNLTPLVSIAALPGDTICAGTSVTFTATPVNEGTPTYQWLKNGNVTGINSNVYTDAALNDLDTISCIMTSSLTCLTNLTAFSNNEIMTVVPYPIATITPGGSVGLCANSTVMLSASSGINFTYLWSTNETTASITVASYGSYSVTITNPLAGCATTSAPVSVIIGMPTDINQDGITNITDFNIVLGSFGLSCTCAADVNNDGIVNISDFNSVLGKFGLACQ